MENWLWEVSVGVEGEWEDGSDFVHGGGNKEYFKKCLEGRENRNCWWIWHWVERKRGIKDDSEVLSPSNWVNASAIYWDPVQSSDEAVVSVDKDARWPETDLLPVSPVTLGKFSLYLSLTLCEMEILILLISLGCYQDEIS